MPVRKLSSLAFCLTCAKLSRIALTEHAFTFHSTKHLKVSERTKAIPLINIEYSDWLVNKEKV